MEDDGYYSSPQFMICSCKEETLNNEAEWEEVSIAVFNDETFEEDNSLIVLILPHSLYTRITAM